MFTIPKDNFKGDENAANRRHNCRNNETAAKDESSKENIGYFFGIKATHMVEWQFDPFGDFQTDRANRCGEYVNDCDC